MEGAQLCTGRNLSGLMGSDGAGGKTIAEKQAADHGGCH